MTICALDLEMNQPSGKIIQIGAVFGNLQTGELITEFNVFTQINEQVSEYIEQLTGITNAQLAQLGVPLPTAARQFCQVWDSVRQTGEPWRQALTWGGNDVAELKSQLSGQAVSLPFSHRHIDVKTWFALDVLRGGRASLHKTKGGLEKVMQRYGLRFEGTPHNALDDARNTFRLAVHMIQLGHGPKTPFFQ